MTFPVPTKNPGEWRGVVDMRGPNTQTKRSNYPLPVIEVGEYCRTATGHGGDGPQGVGRVGHGNSWPRVPGRKVLEVAVVPLKIR